MPLQDKRASFSRKSRAIAMLAMFLAYAVVIGAAERAIPFQPPVPGVRLGLANVVVLAAVYLFPLRECLTLVLLKCLLISLFSGSAVSLLYSLAGSLLSFFGMLLILRLLRGRLSPVGVSVFGAVLHNTGQLAAASLVMRSAAVFAFLPVLLISGAITGALTGLAVNWALPRLRDYLAAR